MVRSTTHNGLVKVSNFRHFFSILTTSFIVEWYLISNWIVDEDPSDRRMGPLQKTICTSICLPFTSVNKPTEIEADHRFHHPPALTSSRTKRRAVKWPAKTPLEPIYVYRSRLVPKVLCRCCCCTWSFQLKRSRRRCQWRREGNQAPVVVLFCFVFFSLLASVVCLSGVGTTTGAKPSYR